jgi:hypothetical protein
MLLGLPIHADNWEEFATGSGKLSREFGITRMGSIELPPARSGNGDWEVEFWRKSQSF